ncbi:hypothetical protein F2Q68_00009228 [Brassica cretica]|nr:hypothetical protein F2Q68_00009228 [Brassica cretica]
MGRVKCNDSAFQLCVAAPGLATFPSGYVFPQLKNAVSYAPDTTTSRPRWHQTAVARAWKLWSVVSVLLEPLLSGHQTAILVLDFFFLALTKS